ncbi:MAG: sensor histidine kinase [Mycobacteriaceae bacterium]|nr:sensor histidine kinase [Mycobacteriaceae bacterium]
MELAFWRAIAVFRLVALAYAALLLARAGGYAHPAAGWVVIGLMAAWTAASVALYAGQRRRDWPLLAADLAVTVALLWSTRFVQTPADMHGGTMPVTAVWVAGPVLAWAVRWGRRAGLLAAVVLSVADLWQRGVRELGPSAPVNGSVLLLIAGVVIGHVAAHARAAEATLERAAQLEAATRERERLARGIHDSVLQVLALVQKRGQEIGGDAAELGRLAGEQEAKLRELVQLDAAPVAAGRADLRVSLRAFGSPTVTIAVPGTALTMDAHRAAEIAAAVAEALHNVRKHCGPDAAAWILAEHEGDRVVVTVRDDGPGIPDDRLRAAEADGRLGVASSIRGRIADLGGTVTIDSPPGRGTEVELTVPLPDIQNDP